MAKPKYHITEKGKQTLNTVRGLRAVQKTAPTVEDIQQAEPSGIPPGWDYQTAVQGPAGEPQAPNQQGWDPYGRPYYGSGVAGYLRGMASRITKPIGKTPELEDIEEARVPLRVSVGPVAIPTGLELDIPDIRSVADILAQRASNLGRVPGTEVGLNIQSAPTLAGRGASEVIRGGLELVQQPARAFERYVGGTAAALVEAGETSALEPLPQPQLLVPEQLRNLKNTVVPRMDPVGLGYNLLRTVTSGRPLEEIKDIFSRNLEASRILYTTALDPLVKQEFLRRAAAGEDPALLAMELENPLYEAVGQTVLDPLNLIGVGAGKARDARRVASVSDEFINVADPGVAKALDGLSVVGEAGAVSALEDLVTAHQAAIKATRTGLDDFAKDTSLFALTTDGARFHTARRAEEMFAWITHNSKNADEALETVRGLALAASDDPAEAALGLDIINNFKAPRPLYSRAGNELAILAQKLIGDDPVKFLDDLAEITKDGDLAKVVEHVDQKMSPIISKMFPTIAERVEAGEDVGGVLKALSRFDAVYRSNVMRPINSFFAAIYMGMSPGYAFRNLVTNSLHVLVDEGPGAFRFGPKRWLNEASEYLGGRVPKAFGFAPARAADVKSSSKFYGFFMRQSEKFEAGASAQVLGHSIQKTMRKMLQPGRAIPDVAPLINAGMPQDSANLLMRLVADNKGNVGKAEKLFREAIETGSEEIFRSVSNLTDPEDLIALHELGFADEINELLARGSADEAVEGLKGILTEMQEEAAKVQLERSAVPKVSEFVGDAAALGAAREAGYIPDEVIAAAQSRYVAAGNAMFDYRYAIDRLRDQAWMAAAQQGVPAPQIERIIEGYRGIFGEIQQIAQVRRKAFMDSVWHWSDEIKNMPDETDWASVWKRIGISGEIPEGLTQRRLLNILWDDYGRPTADRMVQAIRDQVAVGSEAFAKEMGTVAGFEVNTPLLRKARESYLLSLQFDNAAILRDNRLYRFGVGGELFEITSAQGINNSRHLLNAINAYLPEGVKPFEALHDVPPNVARKALGARGQQKATEALEAAGATSAEELIAKGIPEETARAMTAAPEAAAVPQVTDALRAYDEAVTAVDEARQGVTELGRLDSLFRARTAAKRNLDDLLSERGITLEEARSLVPETAEAIEVLTPPLADGALPSHARAILENLPGFEQLMGRLENSIRSNWGMTRSVTSLGDEAETALKTWLKTADGRVAEARLLAESVGNAARDFTLLLYPEKRNIDLVLSYIYPYQFWYSRTYTNWLKRTVSNPQVLAAYARYRQTLEKIHAGTPEWWKYNINSNELLGIESDHPLFFNLEQTLNPINGLVGVDFNDPVKRTGWFTTMLDEMGKLGPSTWTPYSIATALALYMRGEKEAAEHWANRLFPQTATIRAATALAIKKPVELDPFTWFFSGGLGPWERRRAGRALAAMDNEGLYPTADVLDAAYQQKGPIWDEAVLREATERGPGQLASFFLGTGFKARTASDMEIDNFYSAWSRFWAQEPDLSPDEVSSGIEALRRQYPFMDALLLSRKGGLDRDRAFGYNVLGRIPPGQSDDFAELVGIDPRLLSKFYDGKGHLEEWADTDRERFMAGIIDLAAVMDMPTEATRGEWNEARAAYRSMLTEGEQRYGEDIWARVDAYFGAKGDTPEEQEKAEMMLQLDPAIGAALDWKASTIINSPTMSAYYTSIEKVEQYYKGLMYDAIEKELGADIWDKWDIYHFLREADPKEARAYYKAHPELKRYGELRDAWTPIAEQKAIEVGRLLPEGEGATLRDIEAEMGLGAQDVAGNFPTVSPGEVTPEMWQGALGGSAFRLVMDFLLDGKELPRSARTKLERIAEGMGMTLETMMLEMQNSLAPVAP